MKVINETIIEASSYRVWHPFGQFWHIVWTQVAPDAQPVEQTIIAYDMPPRRDVDLVVRREMFRPLWALFDPMVRDVIVLPNGRKIRLKNVDYPLPDRLRK